MPMSPHELIQLATVLHTQATPLFKPYAKDSPALVNHILNSLEELPRLLEEGFLEADTINELERETLRVRRLHLWGYIGRCLHG